MVNPWAVCHASVGPEKSDKFESCVKDVKAKQGERHAYAEKVGPIVNPHEMCENQVGKENESLWARCVQKIKAKDAMSTEYEQSANPAVAAEMGDDSGCTCGSGDRKRTSYGCGITPKGVMSEVLRTIGPHANRDMYARTIGIVVARHKNGKGPLPSVKRR